MTQKTVVAKSEAKPGSEAVLDQRFFFLVALFV